MRQVFGDTSFYVSFLNPADALHEAAVMWSRQAPLHVVVTEFVIVELGNFLAKGPQRGLLPGLVQYLRNNPHTTVLPLTTPLLDAGLDLYARRPDKTWSLVDCISFVVMKDQGLTEALTADHHFEQAGFTILLK